MELRIVSPLILVAQPRHVAEVVTGAGHVDDARHELGLAVVDALELGELIGVLVDQLGQAPHQAFTLRGQHVRPGPGLERRAGRSHSAIHVLGISIGDLGDFAPGRRIDDPDQVPRLRFDPLASDQQARAALEETSHGC